MSGRPRVALVSYSTKPRGGVVHTLSLAEAMVRAEMDVGVVSLGDPASGFYRPVAAPYTLVPPPERGETLDERVFASVEALTDGLTDLLTERPVDIVHTQDCISARAAAGARARGLDFHLVRTVHHVDDFTTEALITCQRDAILEPDRLVVVSADWRTRLATEYGRDAEVIYNGVDPDRFPPIPVGQRRDLRAGVSLAADRFVFLAIGGIEPRKGTRTLFRALSRLVDEPSRPALVIVGGHSFQDYTDYRTAALAELPALGLELGRDVIIAGTVDDPTLHGWLRSADALAFPSVKEGWGLVVLEAMTAELPVVASDIAVLQEYLVDGDNAVLTAVEDPVSLAAGMHRVATDPGLRDRLIDGGRRLVPTLSWARAADAHRALYARITSS